MENKDEPLAVRAQTCSFTGMGDKERVGKIIREIIHCRDKKTLEEVINMPLMDEVFVEASKRVLFMLDLPKRLEGESIGITIRLKVPKKAFPEDVLQHIESQEQVEVDGVKIKERGDHVFIFIDESITVTRALEIVKDPKNFIDPSLN